MSDQTSRAPNVIWIFGDQHRGQALGCLGDPNVHTPTLDRMAAEGVHFVGAVAGFPLCCPFRGSLLTGRYPHHCVPGHEHQLPPESPTIAHVLREAGYHTAYFGKWHLDGFHERNGRGAMHIIPPERRGGFDEWVGYENNNSPWDSWVHTGPAEAIDHHRLDGYETDCLTDMLVDYLRRRAQGHAAGEPGPFFAVLSVQPPHDPYLAPREFMARHSPAGLQLRANVPPVPSVQERARRDLAGYYAQIENLDWNLARLRGALEDMEFDRPTYLAFFSDHGDMHGSHGQFRKTAPWQESIRIPMILAGATSMYDCRHGRPDVPLNHVDIAPTTLGLCGVTVPAWMEGTNYAGLFLPGPGVGDVPDSAFLQSVIPTGHGHSVDRPWRGVITRDGWKYVCLEGQPWLMFHLTEDPYELANLAHNTAYRAERKKLHDRLQDWIHYSGDQFALPGL